MQKEMQLLQADFDQEVENKNEMEKLNTKVKKQLGFMTQLHRDGISTNEEAIKDVSEKEAVKTTAACQKYEVELQYLTNIMQTLESKHKTVSARQTKELAKSEEKLETFLKSQDGSQTSGNSQIMEWFKKEKELEGKIETEQLEVKRLGELNFEQRKELALINMQVSHERAEQHAKSANQEMERRAAEQQDRIMKAMKDAL